MSKAQSRAAEEKHIRILAYTEANGEVTGAEIATHLGLTRAAASIAYLVKNGKLQSRLSHLKRPGGNRLMLYSIAGYAGQQRSSVELPKSECELASAWPSPIVLPVGKVRSISFGWN